MGLGAAFASFVTEPDAPPAKSGAPSISATKKSGTRSNA
jgi:hypothetical protein